MTSLGQFFDSGHCVFHGIFGACVCVCGKSNKDIICNIIWSDVPDRDKKEVEQVEAEEENGEVKVAQTLFLSD